MISRLQGTLLTRELDGAVEVETPGGVVYEVDVPLTVLQRLPPPGSALELRTVQVVREDSITLYGFLEDVERTLFRRLLGASGVGARLALAMMSAYSATRLARALVEKDIVALKQISGVGKKTAEKIALELSDKVADLALDSHETESPAGVREAVAALVALGYSFTAADEAIRAVVSDVDDESADDLIRRALAHR